MIRPVLVLAILVGLLAVADIGLEDAASHQAGGRRRAGALLAPAESARLRKQPMLTLRVGGQTHRYGRIEGHWRCLTAFGAPADERGLAALLDGLAGAEGFVVARGAEAAERYGINRPDTITVRVEGPRALQDPGGDVQAEFDLGASVAARDECFLRRRGTPEIWQVSGDLRALIEHRAAPELPPLIAPGAIPETWRAQAQGLAVVEVQGDDAGSFRLVREQLALDPANPPLGKHPWTWVLERSGGRVPCDDERAEAYARALDALPYVSILDPARRGEFGASRPPVLITLVGRTGARLELALLDPLPDRGVPLAVGTDGPLLLIEAPVARRLASAPGSPMAGEDTANPWEVPPAPQEPPEEEPR